VGATVNAVFRNGDDGPKPCLRAPATFDCTERVATAGKGSLVCSSMVGMADNLPFYHADNRPNSHRATPTLCVWSLVKGAARLACVLRESAVTGAGWDLQLFDADGLLSSARLPDEATAREMADHVRRAHLRDGWTDVNSVREGGTSDRGRAIKFGPGKGPG
jgi:hypothetical protein